MGANWPAWTETLPHHWKRKRLKHVCSRYADYGLNEPATSYTPDGIRFLRTSDIDDHGRLTSEGVYLPEELTAAAQLQDGDLLISRSGTVGRSFLYRSALHGPCSFAGYLIRYRPDESLLPSFAFYFTKSRPFQDWVGDSLIAATIGNVNGQKFANTPMGIPPTDEQAAIVAFLDHETTRVDALIAKKRQFLALLEEKRNAIISTIVAKGLNPRAPMKDSGISWLGQIPAHWSLKQLRHLTKPGTTITYGIVQAGPDIDGGVPYIRTSEMAGEELPLEGYLRTSPEIDAAYARSKVTAGDLVIAIRATIGKPLIVPPELEGANLTQGTARFSPRPATSAAFVRYFLRSNGAIAEFQRLSKGVTFKEITLEMLRKFPVPQPPMDEQLEISHALDNQLGGISDLVKKTSITIERLFEYRTAVITSAVTGQIDSRTHGREAAA